MSETLILAAIIAPLVLVPAFIACLLQPVDPILDLRTERPMQSWEGDSPFAEFQRAMFSEIAKSFYLPLEALYPETEYVSVRRQLVTYHHVLVDLIDDVAAPARNS